MKNWYKSVDKKLLNKQFKLKGYEQTGIKYSPFFLLASGRSNLGKTNAIVDLLHRQNGSYDKVILCCMSFLSDPLYVHMKSKNKDSFDVFEKEVPDIEPYIQSKKCNLIIFDDMVGDKRFEPAIQQWFKRGRKAGFSMIFISQNWFKTDILIRRSLTNVFLFPSSNITELRTILREYPFLDEYEDEVEQYKHIVKTEDPSDFLNINIQNATACIDFELYD